MTFQHPIRASSSDEVVDPLESTVRDVSSTVGWCVHPAEPNDPARVLRFGNRRPESFGFHKPVQEVVVQEVVQGIAVQEEDQGGGGQARRASEFHLQTLIIYKLGFNENHYTFTLTSLIRIVLCSKCS